MAALPHSGRLDLLLTPNSNLALLPDSTTVICALFLSVLQLPFAVASRLRMMRSRVHFFRLAIPSNRSVSVACTLLYSFPAVRSSMQQPVPPGQSQARLCLDSVNPLSWRKAAHTIERLWPHRVTFQWWHPFFAPCYATILASLKRTCPEVTRILISHNTRPHERVLGQDLALRLVARLCDEIVVHSRSEYDLTTQLAPDALVHIVDYPLLGKARALPKSRGSATPLGSIRTSAAVFRLHSQI